jgi:Bacterial Ig domain
MKNSLLLFLLILLIACSKEPVKEKDYTPPVLALSTPVDNQSYTNGESILISGSATDNKYIDQIHIVITNLVTGQEYLHVHIHPGSNSSNFSQPYTAQAGISYKIQVIVDDGSTNSTGKSVEVSCN